MDLMKTSDTRLHSRVLHTGKIRNAMYETMKAETLISNMQTILFAIDNNSMKNIRQVKTKSEHTKHTGGDNLYLHRKTVCMHNCGGSLSCYGG